MLGSPLLPPTIKDRFDVYRFFNGLSVEGKEGLNRGRTHVPLVKTFLLEHAGSHCGCPPKTTEEIFRRVGAKTTRVDDSFTIVSVQETPVGENKPIWCSVGCVEQYDQRFFAYYTCEESKEARKRVAHWIQQPDLDSAWFSSPLLQALWNQDVSKRGDSRHGKLVFKHESLFEMPEDAADDMEADEDAEEQTDGGEEVDETEGDVAELERRKSRFEMADRIGRIRASLHNLQRDYLPLNALYAVRLPSRTFRGGHDLFQNGQVTNRSDSFEDHRNTVRYLYRIYRSVLDATEEQAWAFAEREGKLRRGKQGVPLIVRFEEPLSKATFDRWIALAFQKRNRFKLWGDPIRLGPTKVHVYGADRHLWQPINLELTADALVALLPRGTCGNTFHRLVANIQHYVSPKIQAWIGEEPFMSLVGNWPVETEDENAA